MNSRILSETKLDFYAAKPTLKVSAFTLIVSIAIGAATKQPTFTPLFVMVFAVFMGGMVFSTHEKNHTEKLYGILPLKKSEMIAGRYLYALIISAVNIVIGGALEAVVSKVIKVDVNPVLFWGSMALAFIYYCFAVGVSYPIYLKLGFSKAYVFTMVPMYAVVLAFMFLTRRTNFTSELNQFIQFFSDNLYLIPIFGVLIGLILLTVSSVIANLIYKRKEI